MRPRRGADMDRREYAHFKRALDCYCADPAFRASMEEDAARAISGAGLKGLDPAAAKDAILWIVYRQNDPGRNIYVSAVQAHDARVSEYLTAFHGRDAFASDRLYAYEEITRARCRTESALIRQNGHIYYYPMAMELSRGCSVQCPFCGFAAPRHQADFRYTPENAALFGEIAQAVYAWAGKITGACPLYFATEPFDNPDYERFMLDFRRITGAMPQTTTAVADAIPDRFRRWMDILGPEEIESRAALRISVRSLSQFRRLIAAYSPEETAFVEMLANNPESAHRLSASGRAAKNAGGRRAERYSISCVSGLKISMTDRRAAFIEPELPDDKHPLGIGVRGETAFSDADGFAALLEAFDRKHVFGEMPKDAPLGLNVNTPVREEGAAWIFEGDGCGYRIGRNFFTDAIVRGIIDGRSFRACLAPFSLDEAGEKRLFQAFNALYIRGYVRQTCI